MRTCPPTFSAVIQIGTLVAVLWYFWMDLWRIGRGTLAGLRAGRPLATHEARLGWSMPVRSMRYWLAGIPDPAAVFDVEVDPDGLPVRIVQRGWDVHYGSWQAVGEDRLPRKIMLERADLRIRVVAERWVLAAGGTP